MRLFSILILIPLIIVACSEEKTTDPPKTCGASISIVSDTVGLPHYYFGLNDATLNENCLSLVLDYGGGCGEVSFDLYSFGEYELNDTLHQKVFIAMTTNDPCEMLIEKEYMFDIAEINNSQSKSYYLNFVNVNDSLLVKKD